MRKRERERQWCWRESEGKCEKGTFGQNGREREKKKQLNVGRRLLMLQLLLVPLNGDIISIQASASAVEMLYGTTAVWSLSSQPSSRVAV